MSESPGSIVVNPVTWRMARHSLLFLFDVATISRGDGDLLEPLLLTAVLQANQAVLQTDPELQLRYGDPAWALPDEHRRPISVNAVAQSLGLPYETVRRRMRGLADRGEVALTPAGAMVPAAVVTSERYLQTQLRRIERLKALDDALVSERLLSVSLDLKGWLDVSVRAADRLLANYMLRACGGLLEVAGGAMDGMVLIALAAANVRDLPVAAVNDWKGYGDLAHPCSANRLASLLGMPGETVRRHLHCLAQAGFCRRTTGGWIASAPPEKASTVGRLAGENAHDLRRLFAGLSELAARSQQKLSELAT